MVRGGRGGGRGGASRVVSNHFYHSKIEGDDGVDDVRCFFPLFSFFSFPLANHFVVVLGELGGRSKIDEL